jgi:hypothetical protein
MIGFIIGAKLLAVSAAIAVMAHLPRCPGVTVTGYSNDGLTIVGTDVKVENGAFTATGFCAKINSGDGITSSTLKVFSDKNGDGKITCDEQVGSAPHSGGSTTEICTGSATLGPESSGNPSVAFCGEIRWGSNNRACFDGKSVSGSATSQLGPPCCPPCETNPGGTGGDGAAAASTSGGAAPASGGDSDGTASFTGRVHGLAGELRMTLTASLTGDVWTVFVPSAITYDAIDVLLLDGSGNLTSTTALSPVPASGGTQAVHARQIADNEAYLFRLRLNGTTLASSLYAPAWAGASKDTIFGYYQARL